VKNYIIGFVGTATSIGLTHVQTVAGILAGLGTAAYMFAQAYARVMQTRNHRFCTDCPKAGIPRFDKNGR
jgi:hypothetical protein